MLLVAMMDGHILIQLKGIYIPFKFYVLVVWVFSENITRGSKTKKIWGDNYCQLLSFATCERNLQ